MAVFKRFVENLRFKDFLVVEFRLREFNSEEFSISRHP